MVDDSPDDSIDFQLAKLLREHLLGNLRDCTLQVGEAQHLAAEEMKHDQQLPAAFEELERMLDTLRGRNRISSFQRPSTSLKACSMPCAAEIGV